MFVGLSCCFILFFFSLSLTEQWKPINPEEKKQYDREFLLGFQFISASMHKPEGLPHISDVVLDKVNHLSGPHRFNLNYVLLIIITPSCSLLFPQQANKTPLRPLDARSLMNCGPDFTPSYANLGRPSSGGGGRGPVSRLSLFL